MFRRRTQVAKGAVCKTVIHQFESGRRLNKENAEVVKLVDTWDLKSHDPLDRAGSTPALGTKL